MRHVDLEDVSPEVRELVGSADGEPVAMTDGERPVAWVVAHHEYATLLAMAQHGRGERRSEPEGRRDVAKEFEERKAANLSVQEAYAYRQQLWTIKA